MRILSKSAIWFGLLLAVPVFAQTKDADDKTAAVDCSREQFDNVYKVFRERQFRGSPELLLTKFVRECPNSPWFRESSEYLLTVQEEQADRSLYIAIYYQRLFEESGGGIAGARSRYQTILGRYPRFSRTDQVLLLLAKAYAQSDDREAALSTYVRLINDFPLSEYVFEAYRQLDLLGSCQSSNLLKE